mmetsp:Transcript_56292/g.155827  ORF Transcript_56292/g.155827 Transcript_56292/m.155827 type:complete len:235 (-) Transcript_56292:321-1025(-)
MASMSALSKASREIPANPALSSLRLIRPSPFLSNRLKASVAAIDVHGAAFTSGVPAGPPPAPWASGASNRSASSSSSGPSAFRPQTSKASKSNANDSATGPLARGNSGGVTGARPRLLPAAAPELALALVPCAALLRALDAGERALRPGEARAAAGGDRAAAPPPATRAACVACVAPAAPCPRPARLCGEDERIPPRAAPAPELPQRRPRPLVAAASGAAGATLGWQTSSNSPS